MKLNLLHHHYFTGGPHVFDCFSSEIDNYLLSNIIYVIFLIVCLLSTEYIRVGIRLPFRGGPTCVFPGTRVSRARPASATLLIRRPPLQVCTKTLSPSFDEEFIFDVPRLATIPDLTLEVLIYDYDQFSRDECIGAVHLALAQLELAGGVTATVRKGISAVSARKEEVRAKLSSSLIRPRCICIRALKNVSCTDQRYINLFYFIFIFIFILFLFLFYFSFSFILFIYGTMLT